MRRLEDPKRFWCRIAIPEHQAIEHVAIARLARKHVDQIGGGTQRHLLHRLKSNESDDVRRVRRAHDFGQETRLAAARIAAHESGGW